MAFLSHIILSEGIEVKPNKKKVVKNWTIPLSPTNIRSFLCLARYYRRFVDGLSSIAFPLTNLNQKKVIFEGTKACEKGFQKLKDNLTSTLVLTLPKDIEGFVVYCDGCVLMQHGKLSLMPPGN